MSTPLILAVAPNGAYKSKSDHQQLPVSIKEIALEAKACSLAGASMLHLHVRNNDGSHSLDVAIYSDAIAAIKELTDDKMFIQVTSEAGGVYQANEQMQMIEKLKPEAVSIGLREIKTLESQKIREHFLSFRQNKTEAQIILYNRNDLNLYEIWLANGTLPAKSYPILLVIGKRQPEGVFEIEILSQDKLRNHPNWMVCAFGMKEHQASIIAAHRGGHVRIGFENNLQLLDGSNAGTNAELVAQTTTSVFMAKRPLASLDETRKLMRAIW